MNKTVKWIIQIAHNFFVKTTSLDTQNIAEAKRFDSYEKAYKFKLDFCHSSNRILKVYGDSND